MKRKDMTPIVTIPAEFSLLFFVPVVGLIYIFDKFDNMLAAFSFYLFAQVGLAMLARYIYG
jgi:hypothetical protein